MRRTFDTGKTLAILVRRFTLSFAVIKMRSIFCSSEASAVAFVILFVLAFMMPDSALAAKQVYPLYVEDNGTTFAKVFLNPEEFEGLPWTGNYKVFIGSNVNDTSFSTNVLCNIGPAIGTNFDGTGQYNNNGYQNDINNFPSGSCITSGTYYTLFLHSTDSSKNAYMVYNYDATTKKITYELNPTNVVGGQLNNYADPKEYKTRIISATPTIVSNKLQTVITYYIDLSEFSNQYDRPDTMVFNLRTVSNTQIEQIQKLILPLTQGTSTVTLNGVVTIANNTYAIDYFFWNFASQRVVFNRSYLTQTFLVTGSTISNLQNNYYSGVSTLDEWQDRECSFTKMDGCIINAMHFLFAPSTIAVNQLKETYQLLWNKAPFAYISDISQIVSELFPGGTSNYTIGINTGLGNFVFFDTNTFNSMPYREQLRGLMAAVLWIGFAFLMYRKAINIHHA